MDKGILRAEQGQRALDHIAHHTPQLACSGRNHPAQNDPDAQHSARMKSASSLTRATSREAACVPRQQERLDAISSGRMCTSDGSVRAIKHANTPIPAPPLTAAAWLMTLEIRPEGASD